MMWQAATDDDDVDVDDDSATPPPPAHSLDQLQLNDANRQLCTKVCNTFLQQAFAHHNMLPHNPHQPPPCPLAKPWQITIETVLQMTTKGG